MKVANITISLLLVLFGQIFFTEGATAFAQSYLSFYPTDTLTTHSAVSGNIAIDSLKQVHADSIAHQNDSLLKAQSEHADTSKLKTPLIATEQPADLLPKPKFVPDPKRALWLSLVLPGAGQIYNRKYWKLPIIYGGFVGCTYALLWNQQMYKDYSQAYLDIMDDDPKTDSYQDMLPPGYDITGKEDQFKRIFKNKKNYYRKYRDLSAFCFIGVYILSVIDAYVDAQLSVFDISRDLSMKVEPAVINQTNGIHRNNALGLQCSFNF
jgi:hypothetical protein